MPDPRLTRFPAAAPLPFVERGSGFEVVGQLGLSATSEVLLAISHGPLGVERRVALKRLPEGAAHDPVARARLGSEALAHARISHPAVVRMYDFVEHEGRLTIVLELVEGLPLSRVVDELSQRGERLHVLAVWYVGYRLFQALAALHAARDPITREFAPVIHRHVSPEDVLLPWDGFVKLSDLGRARLSGVVGATTGAAGAADRSGYVAPEQARGEDVSVRTDVYAACLVVRELLLGQSTFHGGPIASRAEFAPGAPFALPPIAALRPELPRHVAQMLDRGLTPDPEGRCMTAEEMAKLLRDVLGDVEAARAHLVSALAGLRYDDVAAATSAGGSAAPAPPRAPSRSGLEWGSASQERTTVRPTPLPHSEPVALMVDAATSAELFAAATPRINTVPPRSEAPFYSHGAASLSLGAPSATRSEGPEVVASTFTRWPRWALLVAAIATAVGGATFGVLARPPASVGLSEPQRGLAAPAIRVQETSAAVSSASKSPPEQAPAVVAPPEQAPAVVAPTEDAPPSARTGRVLTEPEEQGHRVFLDGRFAGAGGGALVAPCGSHTVRVGSAGRPRVVVIPCGGEVTVTR